MHFRIRPLPSQVALVIKNLPANAGDARDEDLIPESVRSPGRENGTLLQYSCLENFMGREAWWATLHGTSKSWTRLSTSQKIQHLPSLLVFHISCVPILSFKCLFCSTVFIFTATVVVQSSLSSSLAAKMVPELSSSLPFLLLHPSYFPIQHQRGFPSGSAIENLPTMWETCR